jgi:predicted neuraminidase
MGEDKNAMPIMRKKRLKRRLYFIAFVFACYFVLAWNHGSSRSSSRTSDGDWMRTARFGGNGNEFVRTRVSEKRKRIEEEEEEEEEEENDDDDNDGQVTSNSAKSSSSSSSRMSLNEPEFAFGGKWGPRRDQAKMNEHLAPTFGCHATTSLHSKNKDTGADEVVVAWFGGSYEGAEDVGIWTASRDERTGSWTKPVLAAKKFRNKPYEGKNLKHNSPYNKPEPQREGGEPHWNPVLFCAGAGADDGDGAYLGACTHEIVLYFKLGWKIWFWETWEVRSRDGGKTWSEPHETVKGDKGGRGPVKNKPIVLADGSWLAPASLEGPQPGQKRKQWRAFADMSTDRGKTWHPSSIILPSDSGYGNIQPTVWESSPGNVHMLLRSSRGRKGMWIWRSDSKDGGKTWTQSRKSKLPNNNSGLDVAYLPKSKTLVLAYNHVMNVDSRSPIRLAISKDNGENWELQVELENEKGSVHNAGHEYSYPSCVPWPKEYGEEGVTVTYTWHRRRVAFFSASLKDLLARAKPNDQLTGVV